MSAQTAKVIVLPARRRSQSLAAEIAQRGYFAAYRRDQVNHCPGCGRSHWWIGRVSAECAFCKTALPFAHPGARDAL